MCEKVIVKQPQNLHTPVFFVLATVFLKRFHACVNINELQKEIMASDTQLHKVVVVESSFWQHPFHSLYHYRRTRRHIWLVHVWILTHAWNCFMIIVARTKKTGLLQIARNFKNCMTHACMYIQKFDCFVSRKCLWRLEMLLPYVRDLVRETKQLNFLTAHARMRHATFTVSCNQLQSFLGWLSPYVQQITVELQQQWRIQGGHRGHVPPPPPPLS